MEAFFISGCGRRGRKMSLPKFSSYIRASLENGQILPIINALVEECANHILSNGDMRSKSEYRAFCKKMCEIHPCLAFPGRHEWSHFSKRLSQKIRTLRMCQKKLKSQLAPLADNRHSDDDLNGKLNEDSSDMSTEVAAENLKAELSKPNTNWPSVVSLFEYLHYDRRSQLCEMTTRNVTDILEKFPALGYLKLIREEFKMLVTRSFDTMKFNYVKMLQTVSIMLGCTQKNAGMYSVTSELNQLLALQSALSCHRIKTNTRRNALEVHTVHSVDLSSIKGEPPFLLISYPSVGNLRAWIVADGQSIPCSTEGGIFGIIIDLLACYYAWDLSYPKAYQILGFLQEHVAGNDSSKLFKSSKFLEFEKKFIELC